MRLFSKVGMVAAILLLTVIALHPFINPIRTIAAEHYTYVVVSIGVDPMSMEKELNKRAADGWELVAPVVSAQAPGVALIFRKNSN